MRMMRIRALAIAVLAALCSLALCSMPVRAQEAQEAQEKTGGSNTTAHRAASQPAVLTAVEAARILPPSVFFHGRTASLQGRNSGGVRFQDTSLLLVALVDTSGYSSQVQERYQAYLINETAVEIDGRRLPPGAYGCGFVGDSFVVLDVGGHDVFQAHATRDAGLERPRPLQVVAAQGAPGEYRLYAGRSYIGFRAATGGLHP